MKKIAQVITRMVPGGAAMVVKQLINGGTGRYVSTLFCGPEDFPDGLARELDGVADVVTVPSLIREPSPFSDFAAYRFLRDALRDGGYDVVHTHTSKAGVLGRFAARRAGVQLIAHTPHGTIYSPSSQGQIPGVSRGGPTRRAMLIADRWVGKATDWLVTLSNDERDLSIRLGLAKKDRIVVIPNGVDVDLFRTERDKRGEHRLALGLENDDVYVVSVGRLTREKGHADLLKAFRRVVEKNTTPSIKLGVVGDGELRDELENECADLTKKGVVVFHGFDSDVAKYLSAADLFALPSRYEGFGIAVVEAMAAGLPVVASDVGGVPDVVRDQVNGRLVPPGDVERFAEAIIELATDSERRDDMGKTNMKAAGEYSTERMLERYYALYG